MRTSITFMLLVMVSVAATAMSPGSSSSYWKPENVPELSAEEASKLAEIGCQIKSFREDDSPQRSNSGTDEHDYFMVTRSEFAANGQSDLVVFCKSAETNAEYLMVLWGGQKRCPSKIPMEDGSRYYKEYGPSESYYGDVLKPLWAAEVTRYLNGMYDQYLDLDPPPEEAVRLWRLAEKDLPPFKHDALHFGGDYNLVLYCDSGEWIPLLDAFSSFVND